MKIYFGLKLSTTKLIIVNEESPTSEHSLSENVVKGHDEKGK